MTARQTISLGLFLGLIPLALKVLLDLFGDSWHYFYPYTFLVLKNFEEMMFFGMSTVLAGVVAHSQTMRLLYILDQPTPRALSRAFFALMISLIMVTLCYVAYAIRQADVLNNVERSVWVAVLGVAITLVSLVLSLYIQYRSAAEHDRWVRSVESSES